MYGVTSFAWYNAVNLVTQAFVLALILLVLLPSLFMSLIYHYGKEFTP